MVLEMLARQESRSAPSARPARRPRSPPPHGEQRHHRLAGADIALQQPQHALGLAEIGVDVGERARWRRSARRAAPRSIFAAGVRRRARARPPGRRMMGAHQRRARAGPPASRHRPAATTPGPPAWQIGRLRRPVQRAQRLAEARPLLAREQARHRAIPAAPARARAPLRRPGAPLEAQPLGERIDRLDRGQLGERGFARPRDRDAPSAACRHRAPWCPTRCAAAPPAAAGRCNPCGR